MPQEVVDYKKFKIQNENQNYLTIHMSWLLRKEHTKLSFKFLKGLR